MNRRWWLFLTVLLLVDAAVLAWWVRDRREHRHDRHIVSAARRYELPPALIKAVVWQESRFHADARGTAGELGLMQIREPAAQEWAKAEKRSGFVHRDLLQPELNTLAGAWYLRKLLARYRHTDDPLPYALADYNAGRTHVLRWNQGAAATNSAAFLAAMDYPGTRRYITAVTNRFAEYQQEFPATLAGP